MGKLLEGGLWQGMTETFEETGWRETVTDQFPTVCSWLVQGDLNRVLILNGQTLSSTLINKPSPRKFD